MNHLICAYHNYNEQEILSLYESVGWTNYTGNPQMLRYAYAHSLNVYAAYVNGKLAGIIRVVGDGFSVVFIQDLLVFPEYQRNGIGTALLQKVLQEYGHVYQLHLMTENTEKTLRFYQSLGFTPAEEYGCLAFSKYHIE